MGARYKNNLERLGAITMRRIEYLDVSKALKRFKQLYATPSRRDDLVPIWLDILGSVSFDAFRFGCRKYETSDETYFPKPGQILRLSLDAPKPETRPSRSSFREDYKAWCATTYDEPCPVCGAVWTLNAFEGNANPLFGDSSAANIADLSGGAMGPCTAGVLHVKADHDKLDVPIRWEAVGVTHDGFWR